MRFMTRRIAVVIGIRITSSWSCPQAPEPFGVNIPSTLNWRRLIEISRPVRSASGLPVSLSAMVTPQTQTFCVPSISDWVKKLPRATE